MGTLWQNLRFAIRVLVKSSGFTAVLAMALGISVIAAIYPIGWLTAVAQKPIEQPQALSANQPITKNGESAKATYERLKKLEGKWTGRSTKGWTEAITFKTIAQGSVVHESSFDAHPNETMATMYYLDGERLLLTHYCVSKTQPRLQATAFEDGGRKVTFTFLDGGNLPSRDKGHMDKVVINFIDDSHFTSHWTWYQQGNEKWLEEIKYERAK